MTTSEDKNRMLTVREAAELLGISQHTCRRLIDAGTIPSWRPDSAPGILRIPYWALVERVTLSMGIELPAEASKAGFRH